MDSLEVESLTAEMELMAVSLMEDGSGIESRRAESPRVKAPGCGAPLRELPYCTTLPPLLEPPADLPPLYSNLLQQLIIELVNNFPKIKSM